MKQTLIKCIKKSGFDTNKRYGITTRSFCVGLSVELFAYASPFSSAAEA